MREENRRGKKIEKKARIAELSWSRAVFLCSSVSGNRSREEKWRREESVGGHSHLPGVVFLPFIWTGIGIQFQLSVLHLLKHTETHTHTHTHTTRSGGKSKGCLNSTETLQRLSESSCVEQWPQGGDYTLITTHTHTDRQTHIKTHMYVHIHVHKHNPCTLFKAPTTLALAHKSKCTRILPQMWDSGLREGITQTNREQGKASWESLERQQSHLSMARWWKERKGKEMGKETEGRKNTQRNPFKPRAWA